jgi:hypothetical protein
LATIPANRPVSADQPRPAKKRPRGAPLTSARARELALAREAKRREARRLAAERGDVAETAARARSVSSDSSAPRILNPTAIDLPAIVLADLVDNGRGSLVLREPLASPRIDAGPEPVPTQRPPLGSPRLGGKPDLAMSRGARRPAPPDPVELEPVEQAPAPVIPAPLDPEAARAAQAMQAARGRVARRHLAERLANPQRAQFSLPWEPAVPLVGGICSGCSVMIAADRRAGHAVQQATRFPRGQKERCVEWALGITT